MRSRLALAPWWVLSIVTGTVFGAFMIGFAVVQDGRLNAGTIVGGVVGGGVFGAIMGPFVRHQQNQVRDTVQSLSASELRRAQRAVMWGPIPEAPHVRAATQHFAATQLTLLDRMRWYSYSVFSALLLLELWLAVQDGGWWWAAVALFAGMLALTVWQPRHLARRLARLRESAAA